MSTTTGTTTGANSGPAATLVGVAPVPDYAGHPNDVVAAGIDLRVTDTTLRDGSHAMAHRFTEAQVRDTVAALDAAGVKVIEVTHGDGLGTIEHLKAARDAGASVARVATHCSEADVSIQHFKAARDLGFETVGFLMLSHRLSPEQLAAQARVIADAGCQCVYVVDSAGALVLEEASDRVSALVAELGTDAQVGYHGHQNLSFGVANSVLAYRAGARQIDGSLAALGAGAGNSPTEVLVAAYEKLGIATGIDLDGVLSAANDTALGYITRLPWMDRASIVQGYAGVYSSFLLHAERAAARYGVAAHDILRRAGEKGYVGGQEDLMIELAIELASQRQEMPA